MPNRANDPRPNIIRIMSDDLSRGDIGCYGHADRVVRGVELFETEHVRSPCFPGIGESIDDWEKRAAAEGTELPQNVNLF